MFSRRGFLGLFPAAFAAKFVNRSQGAIAPAPKMAPADVYEYDIKAVMADGSELSFSTSIPLRCGETLSANGVSFGTLPDGVIRQVVTRVSGR